MSLVPPMKKNPSHRKLFVPINGHEFPCSDKPSMPNPASTFVPPLSSDNSTLQHPTTYRPANNGVHTRSPPLYSLDSILSFTIGVGLSIGILLALLRYFKTRRDASSTRGTSPTRILAAQETHEENHQVGIPNPIWLNPRTGLRRSQINSVPVFSYCKDEGVIEGTECSVCLGEFEEGERLRLLPKCNHAFHVDCIDTWFKSHKNCPLCRAAISVSSVAGAANRLTDRNRVDDDQESGGNGPDNVTHQACEDSSSRASPENVSIVPVHASADNQAQTAELTNGKPKNNGGRGPSV